jgi:hypothetical protein
MLQSKLGINTEQQSYGCCVQCNARGRVLRKQDIACVRDPLRAQTFATNAAIEQSVQTDNQSWLYFCAHGKGTPLCMGCPCQEGSRCRQISVAPS